MPELIDSFHDQYEFLSNFYHSPIITIWSAFDKSPTVIPTVEHAYQMEKTKYTLSWDSEHDSLTQWPSGAAEILAAATPGKAKRLGRKVKMTQEDLVQFNRNRVAIMGRLLRLKFEYGSELADKLLATQNAYLVEGNNWGDMFWGMCWDGLSFEGEHHLGRLLMEIRAELVKEDEFNPSHATDKYMANAASRMG